MSYTPHLWADGQSGADAVTWLNNMEEGVREVIEATEKTAARLNPADADSAYGRALAMQPLMSYCTSKAKFYRSEFLTEQKKLNVRNTYLAMYKAYQNTGAGENIPITGMTSLKIGDFPATDISGDGFTLNLDGWYLFIINASMTSSTTIGRTAKVKIINKNTGSMLAPSIYMSGLNDLSFAQEIAIASACVPYRMSSGQMKVGFSVDMDGSGACLNGFRAIVRRL